MRIVEKMLLCLCSAASTVAVAQSIPVRHAQGATRGFLAVRSETGKLIASGEETQSSRGDEVSSHLTFTFFDGSLDDEMTTYSQKGTFHLLRDHHVQRGPFFQKPLDITIDAASGKITSKTRQTDGSEKVTTEHMDVPPELANGLIETLLLNVSPDAPPFKLPYLAPEGSKARLVKFAVSPSGTETVRIVGTRRKVSVFRVHIEIGGVAGLIAPVIGKEPKDSFVWVLEGSVPAAMRIITQLATDAPLVSVEQSGTSFAPISSR